MHSQLYIQHVSEGSPAWREIRLQVLIRACGRCERCNDLTAGLAVHHKHYETLGQERLP